MSHCKQTSVCADCKSSNCAALICFCNAQPFRFTSACGFVNENNRRLIIKTRNRCNAAVKVETDDRNDPHFVRFSAVQLAQLPARLAIEDLYFLIVDLVPIIGE